MALKEINGQLFVTVEVSEDGFFDVANAALFISRTPGYVRALAKKGALASIPDDTGEMLFSRETLETYNSTPRHGGRKPGEIPYRTLSSTGRRMRSVIRMVEATEAGIPDRATTLGFLQVMLDADIAENAE